MSPGHVYITVPQDIVNTLSLLLALFSLLNCSNMKQTSFLNKVCFLLLILNVNLSIAHKTLHTTLIMFYLFHL